MKNFGMIVGVLTVLALHLGSFEAHAGKVAVVNLQQALNEVEEGKKAMAAIRNEVSAKKKQLDSMRDSLMKKREELEKKKMVLSKEALEKKANELQAQIIDLQRKAVEYEQQLKKKETESVQKIIVSLRQMVIDIAKKEKYETVFENSQQTLLYSTNATDITKQLIKKYNKRKKK